MIEDLFRHFIIKDNVAGVEYFLENGRDPDHPILDTNLSPIEFALSCDSTEVLIALLEHGADPGICEEELHKFY